MKEHIKELLREIKKEACSCDLMIGWSCHYCKNLATQLESVIEELEKENDD